MSFSDRDIALELRTMLQEHQQRRTKLFGQATTARAQHSPREDELRGELQVLSKRAEILKLAAEKLDGGPSRTIAAQAVGGRKGGKRTQSGGQASSPTPAAATGDGARPPPEATGAENAPSVAVGDNGEAVPDGR